MTLKQQRFWLVVVSMGFLLAAALLTANAFKEHLVFFYAPKDIAARPPAVGEYIRVGGLVEAGSLKQEATQRITFTVTDLDKTLEITYQGALPALFREGQGIVAEGVWQGSSPFAATRILAKHDEQYMPPEVAASLKASGRWKGTQLKTAPLSDKPDTPDEKAPATREEVPNP